MEKQIVERMQRRARAVGSRKMQREFRRGRRKKEKNGMGRSLQYPHNRKLHSLRHEMGGDGRTKKKGSNMKRGNALGLADKRENFEMGGGSY